MPDNARWRLSVMMFLEYVIWGSWLPLLALYLSRFLGFSGTEIGWIFATQAIASVTAVFVSGQIADRYLSTERFLAVSHLVGGLAMLALAYQKTFWPFFVIMLVYMLVYVPDALAHQLDLLPPSEGRAEGVRPGPAVGHDRLDRRELALRLLLEGQGRRGAGAGAGQHLHGGRPGLAGPGRLLAAAAQDPARARSRRRTRRCEAIRLLAVPERRWCCSW